MDSYVAAALTLWAAVLLVVAYIIATERRRKAQLHDAEPNVEPEQEPEPRYRPCTRDELNELFRNPLTPPVIRVMAAAQLHRNGWCSCHDPYDQDGQLTDTDLDWLEAQDGRGA